MVRTIMYSIICLVFIACQETSNVPVVSGQIEKKEAREDSVSLVASYKAQDKIQLAVTADVETKPIKASIEEDAADDPAIWVNPTDPSKSLVYGANKKGGLAVYDLKGGEVAYYPLGNINNVDIIYDFPLGDSLVTVLGCSNRSSQSIDLLTIDSFGLLQNIASPNIHIDTSLIDDIYGFCFAKDLENEKVYCIINGKNGLLQQFEMTTGSQGIETHLKRSIQFDSQTEGMVADNKYGTLYVGEETKGIWKLEISPSSNTEKTLLLNSDQENPNIVYDIEGISIYEQGDKGFIIASSQGNFSYAVFDRQANNRYLGSFKIIDSSNIDGVQETDGLAIVSDSLGVDFPHGIIVFQDGFNFEKGSPRAQNFKYVNWAKLDKIFSE